MGVTIVMHIHWTLILLYDDSMLNAHAFYLFIHDFIKLTHVF